MSVKKSNNQLFREEQNLISSSVEYLSSLREKDSEFAIKFEEVISKYEKLLSMTKKIFNISDRQSIELKRRETEIKNLLDNSNQGFLTFGKDLVINKEYSAECNNIFNKKISGMSIADLLSNGNSKQNEHLVQIFISIYDRLPNNTAEKYLSDLPSQIILNDRRVELNYKIIENSFLNGNDPLIMVICTDITEKYLAEEQIRYLSYHDKLTTLYNRAYIDNVIETFKRTECLPFSIIVGDMNGLKLTNDVFGHKEGDKLLVNMANVLAMCTRKGDIVGRWGGDEFIILLPMTDEATCQVIRNRIMEICRQYKWDPIELSISLGSCTADAGQSLDFTELFRNAEDDMYSNKSLESQANKDRIILSMEKILETICSNNKDHIDRVYRLTLEFLEGVSPFIKERDPRFIRLLAVLHDSDRVATEKRISFLEDIPCSGDEEIAKRHGEIGYRMAKAIGEIEIANTILSVQERWDGLGYPRGLKGDSIPFLARLMAIVHEFEELRNRPLAREEVLEQLKGEKGKQLDPELTDVFLKMIDSKSW